MIRKLTLAAAFGAGYVLGAKAGTQRYQQIVTTFRDFAGKPAVQDMTSSIASTAGQLGDTAKATVTSKVNETVSAVSDKVSGSSDSDVVDLTGGKTGARTPQPAPMPGAAASSTAPDISGA